MFNKYGQEPKKIGEEKIEDFPKIQAVREEESKNESSS